MPGPLEDTASGIVGAVCCVYTGLPFDVVKVRMQTRREAGALAVARGIGSREGPLTFWRGATPAVTSALVENATVFAANGAIRRIMQNHSATPEAPLSLGQQFACGGLAGVFSAIAICPAEAVKCKLQYQRVASAASPSSSSSSAAAASAQASSTSSSSRRLTFKGPWDCVGKVLRAEGLAGLYRGLPALWARDVPFCGLFFGTYETCCHIQVRVLGLADKDSLNVGQLFVSGGLAGMTGWAVIYPVDVIKTNMQAFSRPAGTTLAPPSMLSVVRSIVASEEGWRRLYRGCSPALVRAFFANAALFTGVEVTRRVFAAASV